MIVYAYTVYIYICTVYWRLLWKQMEDDVCRVGLAWGAVLTSCLGEQAAPHLVLPRRGGAGDWRSPRTGSLGRAQLFLHLERTVVPSLHRSCPRRIVIYTKISGCLLACHWVLDLTLENHEHLLVLVPIGATFFQKICGKVQYWLCQCDLPSNFIRTSQNVSGFTVVCNVCCCSYKTSHGSC